jgi:beta-lactam-binding protein with PASTA domain
MKKSGLRPSLSPPRVPSRMLRLIFFPLCFLLACDPAVADTATPPSTRDTYVRLPKVQVPDFRQQILSEAKKTATTARLRLQVSGEAPVDPSKVVVMEQKPGPNTMVAAWTTVTVVVRVPAWRQTGPSRDIIERETLTVVPELLRRSLSEAQPLVTRARLKLEVRGGAPEDTSRAIVVDQKPPSGTRVRAGTTVIVAVQIQRTEEGALVPDVRRQRLPEAERRVNRARLRLEVAGGWPAEPTLATVVEQKPGPETRVPLNSVVVVVVRSPTRPPDIVSPPAPPQPPIVSPPQDISPPQIVTPPEVPPRDEWVLVPALRQRPLMDALQRVRTARLRLEVTGGWPEDPGRAVVVEQTPAQETRVRVGTSVTVRVLPSGQALRPPPPPPQLPPTQPPTAQPPVPQPPAPLPPAPQARPPRVELVAVPELRQQLLPEARELTKSARLELRVRGQSPADETRTIVVTQRPAAGTRVAAKSTVLVELGAALLVVPELRKHPLDEARKILDEAGFGLALMGDPPSNESRAEVVEQAPPPGTRATAGSTVTVRVKVSRITAWLIAGAGALLAAGAALGIARWQGARSHPATGLPGVRVVANGDVGTQEIQSNGAAAEGFAIRLRGRTDGGSQTVEADARIVAEDRRADG